MPAPRVFEDQLPDVANACRPIVILSMRGRTEIGSTVIAVLERYAGQLQGAGGKLILAGVSDRVLDQIRRTETTDTIAEEDIFLATPILGEAVQQAMAAAEAWLASQDSNGE